MTSREFALLIELIDEARIRLKDEIYAADRVVHQQALIARSKSISELLGKLKPLASHQGSLQQREMVVLAPSTSESLLRT
jgi:hypothetical protein